MTLAGHPHLYIWLALCLLFIALSAIFSGAETGVYCLSRLRLMLAAHQKRAGAELLQKLMSDQPALISTTLLGTNVCNYLAPVCLTVVFLAAAPPGLRSELRDARAELLTTLILTPVVFIFAELIPKNFFQRHAERFMIPLAGFLSLSQALFTSVGAIRLQKALAAMVVSRLKHQSGPAPVLGARFEMYQMLRDSAADGALTRTQASMLERIHKLHALRVIDVMVPHARLVMLSADATRAEIEPIIRQTRHSRMPVFRGDRRRIVGVVHLLDVLTRPESATIDSYMWPPIEFTRETTIINALAVLQQRRRRMAAVVDGAGNCLGIVTVKDLVEEIVGELTAW